MLYAVASTAWLSDDDADDDDVDPLAAHGGGGGWWRGGCRRYCGLDPLTVELDK